MVSLAHGTMPSKYNNLVSFQRYSAFCTKASQPVMLRCFGCHHIIKLFNKLVNTVSISTFPFSI